MPNGTDITTLSNLPEEIFREILVRLADIRNVISLMKTSKVNKVKILTNFSRNKFNKELPFLEVILEDAIVSLLSEAIVLLLDETKEDQYSFLFKGLTFRQKTEIYKIAVKYAKYQGKLNLLRERGDNDQAIQDLNKNEGRALYNLIHVLIEPNILDQKPIQNPDGEFILPQDAKINLRNQNPLLLMLAHRIVFNVFKNFLYLYPAFYATNGKDLITLHNLAKVLCSSVTHPWKRMIEPYQAITNFLLYILKIPINNNTKDELKELLWLFGYSDPVQFLKTFPILHDKFSHNLKKVISYGIKTIPLLKYSNTHLWLKHYPVELIDRILNITNLLTVLCGLDEKHHLVIIENEDTLNKIKDNFLSFKSEDVCYCCGILLNHFAQNMDLEKALGPGNLQSYITVGITNKPRLVKTLLKFSPEKLSYIPEEIILPLFKDSTIKDIKKLSEMNFDDFYCTVYLELWPALTAFTIAIDKSLQKYLTNNKPNLIEWQFEQVALLKSEIVDNIPKMFFEILTPTEFLKLQSVIIELQKNNHENAAIINFLLCSRNSTFLVDYVRNCIDPSIDDEYHVLYQLNTIVHDRTLLNLLDSSEALSDALFKCSAIKFGKISQKNKAYLLINPNLHRFVASGICDYLCQSSEIQSWASFIFSDHTELKIDVLSKAIKRINCSKHKDFLKTCPPQLIFLMETLNIGSESILEKLAKCENQKLSYDYLYKVMKEALENEKSKSSSLSDSLSRSFFQNSKRKDPDGGQADNSSKKFKHVFI